MTSARGGQLTSLHTSSMAWSQLASVLPPSSNSKYPSVVRRGGGNIGQLEHLSHWVDANMRTGLVDDAAQPPLRDHRRRHLASRRMRLAVSKAMRLEEHSVEPSPPGPRPTRARRRALPVRCCCTRARWRSGCAPSPRGPAGCTRPLPPAIKPP